MLVGRVIETVVSTAKSPKLHGSKLLLVEPEDPSGNPAGEPLLAIDGVGAGVGERVLVVVDGRAAGLILGDADGPVDAAIVGIIDRIDITSRDGPRSPGL